MRAALMESFKGALAIQSVADPACPRDGVIVAVRDAADDETVDRGRLARAARQHMDRTLKSVDKSAANIASHIEALGREIDKTINARITDPSLAADVRQHFRKQGKPAEVLAHVQSDPRVSAALLQAPPFLSGLDSSQHEQMREIATRAHAADLDDQRREAHLAFNKLNMAAARMREILEPRLKVWERDDNAGLKALEGGGS